MLARASAQAAVLSEPSLSIVVQSAPVEVEVDVINAFVAGVMEVASVGVVLKLNSCPSSFP
jgi:hypothetical protein